MLARADTVEHKVVEFGVRFGHRKPAPRKEIRIGHAANRVDEDLGNQFRMNLRALAFTYSDLDQSLEPRNAHPLMLSKSAASGFEAIQVADEPGARSAGAAHSSVEVAGY